jgi:hypothetical protein
MFTLLNAAMALATLALPMTWMAVFSNIMMVSAKAVLRMHVDQLY